MRAATVLCFLMLLAPAWTSATVGPPIKVEVVPPPSGIYPIEGQPFSAFLQITSSEDGEVEDFELTGLDTNETDEPWSPGSFSIPSGTATRVFAMSPLSVQFTATPVDPTSPVEFSFLWNGQRYRKQFSLIPSQFGLAGKSGRYELENESEDDGPKEEAQHLAPGPWHRPEPEGKTISAEEAKGDAPRDGVTSKRYNIRVKGRFFYYRSDGRKTGVDSATIWVMDEDTDWDDTLATIGTDANGYFDHTFSYNQSELPDIYLEFAAANNKICVQETDWIEETYTWKTGVTDDFNGTFIDYGGRRPKWESHYPAVHILTTATRTWRFIANRGFDTPQLDIQWPESADNSWYNPFWEEMHINSGKQWRDDTIAHEYGHHWMENFADQDGTDYCNSGDRCDDPDDCNHCLWCQETNVDAWREGFPDFIADFMTDSHAGDYGYDPLFFRNVENILQCDEVSALDDPWRTEGHIAALLRDVVDSQQDDENSYAQGIDELDLTVADMLSLVASKEPITPAQFIDELRSSYPSLKSNIWATCENNGYNLTDTTDPSKVTQLTTTSHSLIGDSPDATIDFSWAAATDNLSGIAGYSVWIGPTPILPDPTVDIGPVTSLTTGEVSAGTYYFSIRSADRAGNWDSGYESFGPITIRDPYPADLTPGHTLSSWAAPVVPRANADCNTTTCGTPSFLASNSAVTYLNVAYRNDGELPTAASWKGRVYVDGVAQGGNQSIGQPVLPVGQVATFRNMGPFNVRGGRHNLGAWIDFEENNPEQDEFGNKYAKQWTWAGYHLFTDEVNVRAAPPASLAGFWGPAFLASPNTDGFQMQQSNDSFCAAVAWGDDTTTDYDVWMYPFTTGTTSGWDILGVVNTGALSGRPAGCLDMTLFRYDVAGSDRMNVGVVNATNGTSAYRVMKEDAITIPMNLGLGIDTSIPVDRHLILRQFDVGFAQNFTVSIDVDPAAGPVQMALYDNNFSTGDLFDYDAYAVVDDNGHAEVTYNTATGGWMCVAIWQDPKDVPAGKGSAPLDVLVAAFTSLSDLTWANPAGWHAPLVPRPADDGTFNSVPAPGTLLGNADATWINRAFKNAGLNSSPSSVARVYVDGRSKITGGTGNVSPGATVTSNIGFPITVKGGRHTLHTRYDDDETAQESNEGNNAYGIQWVWSPLALTEGQPITREIPEDATAGWDDAIEGGNTLLHFNSDGFRTPVPTIAGADGYWQAVATMPGPASDVDVRLHEISAGTINGFRDLRAMSGWGVGQSDFAMTNFRVTSPFRGLDAGIVHGEGIEDYTVEVVSSTYLATLPSGVYNNFTLASGRILNLHEVFLLAGPMNIDLVEESGGVNWGMSLHESRRAYHNKTANMQGALSWLNPTSATENVFVHVPVDGYYCVAVWKSASSDLASTGQYRLEFTPGATTVPDSPGAPRQTTIASIHPNPFNPRTTIAFELARPQEVMVGVYNLRGELVDVLIDEAKPAGQHEVVWNGQDQHGQTVASGIYFARLRGEGVDVQGKMMLLK